MRFLNLLMVVAVFCASLAAQAGSEGNGGGGIVRDGKYLTFGSAKVGLQPQGIDSLSGLSLLLWALRTMPLHESARGAMNLAAIPSPNRKYYTIRSEELSAETRAELIAKYREALSLGANEEFAVFAFTRDHDTFLLPEFFFLSRIQQAAILFHEALWDHNSKLTYELVIKAEMAFEDYLDRNLKNGGYRLPFDFEVVDAIGRAMGDASLPVLTAAGIDLNEEYLEDLMTDSGRLSVSRLFGPLVVDRKYVSDREEQQRKFHAGMWVFSPKGNSANDKIYVFPAFQDFNSVAQRLVNLISSHPKSVLLPALYASLGRISFSRSVHKSHHVKVDTDHLTAAFKAPDEFGIALWGFESPQYAKDRVFLLTDEDAPHDLLLNGESIPFKTALRFRY